MNHGFGLANCKIELSLKLQKINRKLIQVILRKVY